MMHTFQRTRGNKPHPQVASMVVATEIDSRRKKEGSKQAKDREEGGREKKQTSWQMWRKEKQCCEPE